MTYPELLARRAVNELSRWVPWDDADDMQQDMATAAIEAAVREAIERCAGIAAECPYGEHSTAYAIHSLLTDEVPDE
jgi:hypothetical protein